MNTKLPQGHPELFDRSRLTLKPLAERAHNLDVSVIRPLTAPDRVDPVFAQAAASIRKARERGAEVILMMGAHVIRAGMQRYLVDLMEKGFVTLVATNGAGLIHDYEFALIGATTESVARYIKDGRFGLWEETGRINHVAAKAAAQGVSLGYEAGRTMAAGGFPHADTSLFAGAFRAGVPVTVHSAIGQDIVHEHPSCDGAAWGQASYTDFLVFARRVENLDGGVVLNLGSAVMGPEVFLKALAMARNVARSEGRVIENFDTLVTDLAPLPADVSGEAGKENPLYFFRPWKTLLVRTLGGQGQSWYARARHEEAVPQLWRALTRG